MKMETIDQIKPKERPILFSGPMVRAILDGRKTQTRRVVKLPLHCRTSGCELTPGELNAREVNSLDTLCPYGGPTNRLWVRETWMEFGCSPGRVGIGYKASNDIRPDGVSAESFGACRWFNACDEKYFEFKREIERMGVEGDRWHPSIFMPRWASRITLEIISVRVERLQAITHQDVLSEGIEYAIHESTTMPAITAFQILWDSINGKSHPWKSNPWVWVISFKRV